MEGDQGRLRNKQLGTIDCVAQSLAVGPVFSAVLLGSILFGLSGGVSPFVLLMTFVGMLGIGWTVSEFAKRYAGSGTIYEYVAHSLGKRVAVFAGAAYYFAVLALAAAGIPLVGGMLLRMFAISHWGIDWPWWVWSLVVIAAIFVINTIGVQVSVKTQLIVIILSVIPLAILSIKVIATGGTTGNSLDSFNPANVAPGGSLFKGLLFAILLYVGFELAAALGEETADPQRSIPRAVLATLVIVTVVYLVTQYVLAIGTSEEIPPFFEVMGEAYIGRWLQIWIEVALLLDVLAVGIGFCLAGARGIFTLARDGLLPGALGKVSRRDQPQAGNVVVAAVGLIAVAIALAKYGTDPAPPDTFPVLDLAFWAFLVTTTIGGMTICLIYVLLCLGALRRQARRPVDVIAALVGLGIAGLGIAAQFIEGPAPTGDAKWGVWIALVALALCALFALLAPKRAVDQVAQHTLHHEQPARTAVSAPSG
jgi:amino acid transporter